MLQTIDNDIAFSVFGAEINIRLGLPFSWKAFYFAAVAFAIASFVFSVFCPPIIRDHNTFREFADKGMGTTQIVSAVLSRFPSLSPEDKRARNDFSAIYVSHRADAEYTSRLQRAEAKGTEDWPLVAQISEPRLADAFWAARSHLDSVYRVARMICVFCYAIGFLFSFAVLLQGFSFVLRQTFK
jgi:hypothetical protein